MAFLEGLKNPSGVKVLAGQQGQVYRSTLGELILRRAPVHGMDRNLFACAKGICDHLGIVMVVSSVDTGKHSPNSRHYKGLALDIALLAPLNKTPEPVRWPDALADELVAYLHACGFRPYEGGNWPAVLWGAPRSHGNQTAIDHRDHVHCSLPPRRLPGATEGDDEDGEVRCDLQTEG